MTQRQVFRITFLILFILLLYQFGLILSPFFMPILWALILARLTNPMYERLLRWSRGRDNLSAALMTLAIVFIAILPAVYLVTLGIQEAIEAYQQAAEWIQGGGLKRLPELLLHIPVIGKFSQEILGRAVVAIGDLQGSILEGGKVISTFLLTQMGNIAKHTLEFITDFLIMLFTLFFLFRDGRRIYGLLFEAVPLDPEHKAAIAQRLKSTVGAVVKGTLLTAMAQGAVAGVTYWLLGIPFPVFLGGLSALLALLPVGGTAFVWGPLAIYLLLTGTIWKGLTLIAIGAGLVGLMDNILQPWLIGAKANLPLLFLFFATVGGIAYFGFIGLFLGPIILGIVLAAFEIYREEFIGNGSLLVQSAGAANGEPHIVSPAEEERVVRP